MRADGAVGADEIGSGVTGIGSEDINILVIVRPWRSVIAYVSRSGYTIFLERL